MTKKDQKRIVREMCDGLKKTMLEACDKVPDYWDGHELRNMLADLARERYCATLTGARKRDYDNTRLEVNI